MTACHFFLSNQFKKKSAYYILFLLDVLIVFISQSIKRGMNNNNTPINIMEKLSYGLGLCSLLIDTCHTRAFPSYNIVTSAFAFILANSKEDPKSRLQFLSYFSILVILSLVVDIVFCIIWGPEVGVMIQYPL